MTEISAAIETLERLLRDILAEPPEHIDPDCDMIDAFGLSSVDVMDLVSQVEDTWDIAFPLNDLAAIRTLRQLASRVQALGGAQ
jgi:acyl carrier protein